MFPAPLATGREKSGASAPASVDDELPQATATVAAAMVVRATVSKVTVVSHVLAAGLRPVVACAVNYPVRPDRASRTSSPET